MTLNELLDMWLNKYEKYKIKLRTFVTYQCIIEKHIKPIFGNYDLNNLSFSVIQDFIIYKIENGNLKTSQNLTYNSVNLIVSVLKQSLKYAYNLRLISTDYMGKIFVPKSKEKKIEIFNNKEQHLLETYCLKKKNNYIGIILSLYTGIRIGELLALTWDDINFNKNLLTINKTICTIKLNGKTVLHIDEPKTKTSNRIIPFPKQLVPYLKKIKSNSKSKYVISTRNNTPVSIRSYQKTYERILNKLKINYKNFHVLRHTFATRALELGMDIKSLSEILGHKNAMITLNRYSHSMLNYKIEMMNKLGKRITI